MQSLDFSSSDDLLHWASYLPHNYAGHFTPSVCSAPSITDWAALFWQAVITPDSFLWSHWGHPLISFLFQTYFPVCVWVSRYFCLSLYPAQAWLLFLCHELRCRWLCVCLYMYVSSWVYVLVHIKARVNLERHSLLSPMFYEAVTILKLTDQARLTGISPRPCPPCLPSSGITCMYCDAWPFFWFWR